jgi:predicted acetyltransferase
VEGVGYVPDRADFKGYVKSLHDHAMGIGLPPGHVPHTTLWLVEGPEFIGRVNIRHQLTDWLVNVGGHIGYRIRPSKRRQGYGRAILKLALPEAKKLGLHKVLLTCDETNVASKKIIEANGGVLEDKRPNPDGGPDKLRYWIEL